MSKICKKIISILKTDVRKFIVPDYSEGVLFSMTLAILLVYLFNSGFREVCDFFIVLATKGEPITLIWLMFLVSGMILSIYHAFSTKRKTNFQKTAMLSFVIMINLIAGTCAAIYSVQYIFPQAESYMLIFPSWNFFNALFLFILHDFGAINESSISDKNARTYEIAISFVSVVFVFFMSQYVFENYWAITFSICVGYATTINKYVTNLFVQNKIKKDI